MVYDRMEDLAATTKRHPSRIRHRTALDKDGKLLAMDIDVATDGGAYATLSSTVLSRATLHSPGPYVCPNVRVRSPCMGHQHRSLRRVSRLRRAAGHLRRRAPHG
jgi:xanthine dehydrogenase molybdopterin-binding subunit B